MYWKTEVCLDCFNDTVDYEFMLSLTEMRITYGLYNNITLEAEDMVNIAIL